MTDLVQAYALLRLEQLRAQVHAELEEATRWRVTALTSPGMGAQAGPHVVWFHPANPVRGRIDVVFASVADGELRAEVLVGTPSSAPAPPAMLAGKVCPLALVHHHAGTCAVFDHAIIRIDTPEWRVSPITAG